MSEEAVATVKFANKYRPKNVGDMIGQDVVVQSITNAFKSKSLHHAYIFSGKFGCGKTSMARILAAMENCKNGRSLTPCGECENCKLIFSGKSLDVKEMDAASNRGIDDIRALRDEIRYAPVDCAVKYVIIDEAHSLTGQAAEAALKMIEEPPEHVRFILCTTDPHLLKDTIHSRCIQFKFFKVGWAMLFQHIKKIADLEGIQYEEGALKMAAKASGGSVRNSLQNLQTLVNFSGSALLTTEAASQVLGAIDNNLYFKFIESILTTQTPEAFSIIENLLKDGRDAEAVLDGLYDHLRNLMVSKTCQQNITGFGFTENEIKQYSHQAGEAKLLLILEMMNLMTDVSRGLSLNLDPQTLLEKHVIESIIAKKKLEAQASK